MAEKATIILFSHVSNTHSITGAEKLLLFFTRELSLYFNCILVAPQEGKMTRQARKWGLRVELLPIPLVYGMYTPYPGLPADIAKFQESREYAELTGWLAANRPAFIISSTCVHALPAIAAKSLGIPVIWKISETITESEYTFLSVELIDRYSDEILTISHTVGACFPQEMRDAKVTLLPPSWNEQDLVIEGWSTLRAERRRELGISPGEPLVGYISSFINKEKGLEHFVKMAVLVSAEHPKARFMAIGAPGDKSYYERCVKKVKLEGLSSRFRFADYEEFLPSAYCAMDLLVVPSLIREGFGMTALEGFAFGKPVVAYDSGGLREILTNAGCEAQLVPAENIGALAESVNALLADQGRAAILGAMARERIVAAYGPGAYQLRLYGLAERWTYRYASRLPAAAPEPAAADPAPGPEAGADAVPAAANAPRGIPARRAGRAKGPRRGRRRGKIRARRRKRPGRRVRAAKRARKAVRGGRRRTGRAAKRRKRAA
ncbi:glycosyltransferase family 4 protein [Paenibacillus sp. NFR01]|uniref:glycosyltransferase family 4 protein n=1 Tax=Paenibacillus sp. NFR01 TaxID=1566279 RepID=UPI001587BF22|nr:glycosyltransferase family 4 protein [Paenibacillus sp. NFR01]